MEEQEKINQYEDQPTTKQIVLFTVLLSFIASIIGTILTIGVIGPAFNSYGTEGGSVQINRPNILERITEVVTEKEVSERVLRQDELVVTVVEAMAPAVVSIVATKDVPVMERFFINPFFGWEFTIPEAHNGETERREVSSGSGFIVSPDGLILTNRHVVDDPEAEYTVFLNDGQQLSTVVLARDPFQDLAILKIEGDDFLYASLADSTKVKIGQAVIAIGNALGEFRNTVSVGVVSGLQRSISDGFETLQELIQTDAAINPGNSGGPLLNLRGEVIGINTAVARGAQNIGFAIPINKAKEDIKEVMTLGRIVYPFVGVQYMPVTEMLAAKEDLGRDYGILLVGDDMHPAIVPNSPAARAGLLSNDIILLLEGKRIDNVQPFTTLIDQYDVGDKITLTVYRDGEEISVKVTLGERE